jgi:hypothetical protein
MVISLLLYLRQLPCLSRPGDMSFICTVTLTAELLDGGQQEGAQYAAHQCWKASVAAALPPTWQAERSIPCPSVPWTAANSPASESTLFGIWAQAGALDTPSRGGQGGPYRSFSFSFFYTPLPHPLPSLSLQLDQPCL